MAAAVADGAGIMKIVCADNRFRSLEVTNVTDSAPAGNAKPEPLVVVQVLCALLLLLLLQS